MEDRPKQDSLILPVDPFGEKLIHENHKNISDATDSRYRNPECTCGEWTETILRQSARMISAGQLKAFFENNTVPEERKKKIVSAVENGILGEFPMFMDLIETLQNQNEYSYVILLCKYWITSRGPNAEILAAMFNCIVRLGVGEYPDVETYVKTYAKGFPEDNQMLDEAYIGYGKEELQVKPASDEWKTYEEIALRLRQKYPMKEKGYYYLAYLKRNRNDDEATSVLREVIFEKQLPLGAHQKPGYVKCPQCCLLLLAISDNSDDAELILRVCEKGLGYVRNSDDHGDIAYLNYRKVSAMEYLLEENNALDPLWLLGLYEEALNMTQEGKYGGSADGKDYPRMDYKSLLRKGKERIQRRAEMMQRQQKDTKIIHNTIHFNKENEKYE